MEWLEQNIDAYRIVSEILGQLRVAIRQRLEKVFGDTWYKDGLPEEVFDRLVASKERERSIDWYEGHYQQIMDYADFADLIEILEKNASHFPAFIRLAPSSSLLHARFLELDVMREKLGRARPISETELSFLGTFHLRFRKAAKEFEETEGSPPPEPVKPVQPIEKPLPPVVEPATEKTETAAEEPVREKVTPQPPVSPPTGGPSSGAPRRPVQSGSKPVRLDTGEIQAPPPQKEEEPETPAEDLDTQSPIDEPPQPSQDVDDSDDGDDDRPVGPRKLAEALENEDHRAVLREIYREVTTIAEGVWTTEVTPAPLVWEQVTASSWYENYFSRLGLQPLSVFYEVTGKIDKKVREGAERAELQEFLKESNFAKTLLALRDMFQNNNI